MGILIWLAAIIVGGIWGFWPGFWTFIILALIADNEGCL